MEATEIDISGLGGPSPKKNPAAAAIKALRIQENQLTGYRDKFLNRLGLFDPEIAMAIIANRLQLVDHTVYSTKRVQGSSQIDIIADADVKQVGVTNLNRSRFENGEFFLLCAIRMRYDEVTTGDAVYTADFQDLSLPASVRNGEMTLEINSKKVAERFPLSVFDTTGKTTVDKGLYVLENPKVIMKEQLIKSSLYFTNAVTAAAGKDAVLRFEMVGILTQRN